MAKIFIDLLLLKCLGKSQDEVTSEERFHAKAVNFGIIYGISDFGLSRDFGITSRSKKLY